MKRSIDKIILDRTREEALNHEGGYIFDLDGQENAQDGEIRGIKGKFSVDAEICGMVLYSSVTSNILMFIFCQGTGLVSLSTFLSDPGL